MSAKPLTDIPLNSNVLIDANILIYAAGGQSRQCTQLLRRCGREDVHGVTTVEILSEVCHRLMLAEAFASGAIRRATASALRQNRAAISGLASYWAFVSQAFEIGLVILELDGPRFRRAQALRQRHRLLTNDSLLLAAAEMYRISILATRDSDFDGVPWLSVFSPDDL